MRQRQREWCARTNFTAFVGARRRLDRPQICTSPKGHRAAYGHGNDVSCDRKRHGNYGWRPQRQAATNSVQKTHLLLSLSLARRHGLTTPRRAFSYQRTLIHNRQSARLAKTPVQGVLKHAERLLSREPFKAANMLLGAVV